MLLLFVSFIFSKCNKEINAGLGARHYEFEMEEDEYICINTSFYPTYIIVDTFEDDTEYTYYSSMTDTEKSEKFTALLRFLPIYQRLNEPFGAAAIHTPSAAHISITIAALPGMCNNGIYFSNKRKDTIRLSKFSTGFENLQVYDDKCMIFTALGVTNVTFDMISDDYEDQLYAYYTYTNFSSISGNSSASLQFDENNPLIIRIVADDVSPPDWALISIESDGEEPRFEQCDFYVPKLTPPTCKDDNLWYGERLAWMLVIVLGVLVIADAIYVGKQCICKEDEEMMLLSAAEGFSQRINDRRLRSYMTDDNDSSVAAYT